MNKVSALRKPKISPPKFEWTYIYILVIFLGLLTSDIITTSVREHMLPTKAPTVTPAIGVKQQQQQYLTDYKVISDRNIFNSDGLIPEALKSDGQTGGEELPAQLSQLPLSLIGTIVHVASEKSVASIELKGRNTIVPYSIGEDIENMAKIQRIERRKVFIKNLSTNRNEYIEIKEDLKVTFGMKNPVSSGGPIQQTGNDFTVQRSFVDQKLKDLPELLQTASGQFSFNNGRVEGYRILDVEPDSLFTQLGIRPGDLIKSVNGTPLDSPAKAMEFFNEFKSAPRIQLTINRNGRDEEVSFNVQ